MRFRKILIFVIFTILFLSPIGTSAKLQEYKIIDNNTTQEVENSGRIDDIRRSSDSIGNMSRNIFDVNKGMEVMITILLVFTSFAVTSTFIYNFILKEKA